MRDFVCARCREAGNILFMILIAVALFAALSYAVTQSSRGGSRDASSEITSLDAAQIVQYASQIDQAVIRLTTIGGCIASQDSGNTLTFQHDSDGDGDWNDNDEEYYNPDAPTDHSCHVFHPEGGGVAWQSPEPEWLDSNQSGENLYEEWYISNGYYVEQVGTSSVAPPSTVSHIDPFIFLGWLKRDLCLELNEKLNVPNPGGDPPQDTTNAPPTSYGSRYFDGSYNTGAQIGGDAHRGKLSACFEGDNYPPAGTYHFYHVLIAR